MDAYSTSLSQNLPIYPSKHIVFMGVYDNHCLCNKVRQIHNDEHYTVVQVPIQYKHFDFLA